MGNDQNSDRLHQLVADMVALETQIEDAFVQWLLEVQGHAEAAEAIGRFQTMVRAQREALGACLQRVGGSESGFASPVAPFDMTAVPHKRRPHAASNTLHTINTAFNHAAFGYAMLHTTAHRFYERTTADLAEEHRRSYAEAAEALHQLIPDILISEMGKEGECRCECPSCSLGICMCWHAHVESLMPGSPVEEGGILVRLPKANSAALQAGLRHGDVILEVDAQKVQTYQELLAEIRKHGPGDEVHLQTLCGPRGPQVITVTCPR